MTLKTKVAKSLQITGAISLVLLSGYLGLSMFLEKLAGGSKVDQEIVSPGGKFRAVLARTSTGPLGYCYQFVVLLPTEAPAVTPWYGDSQDQAVFIARCHNQATLTWLDATNLKVRLELSEHNDMFSARMRREDAESRIAMHYEVSRQ